MSQDLAARIRERLDLPGTQTGLRDFAELLLELNADGDFGPTEEARQWWRGWNACHRSLVEALATKLETAGAPTPDWRRIAVKMARTGAGFYGLTTPERDALVAAMDESSEKAWIAADVWHERTADAAGGECS